MMNKRLVWNFEIANNNSEPWPFMFSEKTDNVQWEARFFWPDDQPIILHDLPNEFLLISNYKSKSKQDVYFLLPNQSLNLKPLCLERGGL